MAPTLQELLNVPDPAWPLVQEEARACAHAVEVLGVEPARGEQMLLRMQISAHSFLGALVLHTAGVLIDGGWLRLLGAGGHPKMQRSLPDWNADQLMGAAGMMLVADDAIGGFFALDGGALGPGKGAIYHLAPDKLEWEMFAANFTDFFRWSLSTALPEFYQAFRWPTWPAEVVNLTGDQALKFQPYLFTQEGRQPAAAIRTRVAVGELFALYAIELPAQLGFLQPEVLK
ncbi:MAG: DUF2625 family protein [Planctomycetota bacterium]